MADLAVKVENLSVKFGDFFAVNTISFSVNKGEIFGFLGANGAGKTTTIRVLCGLLPPTSGHVEIEGVPVDDRAGNDLRIKSLVGYMSQKFTLYNDLTIAENLDFIAGLRKLKKAVYLENRQKLLEFIAFSGSLNSTVQDLSGGIKQQIALVAALLHDPSIVFLDEPTAGVSPDSRARFWALIRLLAQSGKTVFVTTHYMDEAEQCGRISLMSDGKIIALDTPEGLKAQIFKEPLYEFSPIVPLNFSDLSTLQASGLFSYFEPYGLKFHATIQDHAAWSTQRSGLAQKFEIRDIKPSLEDVFIRSVERK